VTLRPFDLALWGATGFTGRLVAERLARRRESESPLRWAIAGRNREKLEALRASLEPGHDARDVGILTGDGADRSSLDAIARSARVVASTAGPFSLVGRHLVAACADAGTDYCDITGEPQFVRDMIDLHHARARATGARIVHCCGYDSIPSDLGTLVAQQRMRDAGLGRCASVKAFAGATRGGISGGTIASVLAVLDEAERDPRVRAVLADPYALDPERAEAGPDGPDPAWVTWDPDLACWTGPFMGAAINARVVRRTNALLGYAYGRDFRYSEAALHGRGFAGWAAAAGSSVGLAAAARAARVGPLRSAVAKFFPSPGQGPSQRTRDGGYFAMHFVGVGEDRPLGGGRPKVHVVVRGTSDPGYGETAKMLSETALCLSRDEPPGSRGSGTGGVLTPAAAMGLRLVERLRAVGMTFEADGPDGAL
jgi:short subunit dehydrogenase-like uncharacterized protein